MSFIDSWMSFWGLSIAKHKLWGSAQVRCGGKMLCLTLEVRLADSAVSRLVWSFLIQGIAAYPLGYTASFQDLYSEWAPGHAARSMVHVSIQNVFKSCSFKNYDFLAHLVVLNREKRSGEKCSTHTAIYLTSS